MALIVIMGVPMELCQVRCGQSQQLLKARQTSFPTIDETPVFTLSARYRIGHLAFDVIVKAWFSRQLNINPLRNVSFDFQDWFFFKDTGLCLIIIPKNCIRPSSFSFVCSLSTRSIQLKHFDFSNWHFRLLCHTAELHFSVWWRSVLTDSLGNACALHVSRKLNVILFWNILTARSWRFLRVMYFYRVA